ncbi:MAG: NAD(+)/NADH kinase [Verrucomicrobiales bacterium]
MIQTIGLVAHPGKPGAAIAVRTLVDLLGCAGVATVMEAQTARLVGASGGRPLPDVAASTDLIIVLGGDGTLLHTVRQIGGAMPPLCAINIGTLGFLTCGTMDDARLILEAILASEYRLSPRSMVEAVVLDESGAEKARRFGLNEANISRGAVSRSVHLEVRIDAQRINTFSGDGLIIATPTGSTAYSLSAGGPIIDPESGELALTPVCPHALSSRPLIVPDSAKIEVVPETGREGVVLTLDWQQTEPVPEGGSILVHRAGFDLPLVMLGDQDFYGILEHKLGWHGSSIQSKSAPKP